jgi:acyl carrier protein
VVLVSSIAGTMPQAGRGLVDYTLANAYQLALAERENDSALTVTAHAWPNWLGVGMQAAAAVTAAHSITGTEALAGFTTHLRTGGAVTFPGSAATPPPALSEPEAAPAAPVRSAGSPARPSTSVAELQPARQPAGGQPIAATSALVRQAFLDVLGDHPGDRTLQELGLDSLAIADLTVAIERRAGQTVDPSLLMRARTVDDIAAQLVAVAAPTPAQAAPQIPAQRRPSESTLSSLLRPLVDQNAGQ